jgi:2-polyprenyl-6-hydroxyphenyl methylase/3-demethylubiquinone-9 3-methyltransferase
MDAHSYHYGEPGADDFRHHDYLIPTVLSILEDARSKRILDLGCGNGLATHVLATHGYRIIGIDPSEEGINWAREHYPDIEVHRGSTNDDLRARFGTFPVVMSLKVVEHIYDPRTYARTLLNLVEPGGLAIVSTPYNGYLKNLAVALFNKFDAHYNPLWDHRAHQILAGGDADQTTRGSRVRCDRISACRAHSAARQIDGRDRQKLASCTGIAGPLVGFVLIKRTACERFKPARANPWPFSNEKRDPLGGVLSNYR